VAPGPGELSYPNGTVARNSPTPAVQIGVDAIIQAFGWTELLRKRGRSDRVVHERVDSIGESRGGSELEIARCCPVEESHPGSENGRVDQNPILVNQTESDKTLRKRFATMCEKIVFRLGLQVGDFSAEVAAEYASVVPVGWLFQERKSSVELRLCSVAQRRGRFGGQTPGAGEHGLRNGVHRCGERLGRGRPVTRHVGVRPPPDKMCAGFPQL
jgi:hypothetical protein